MDLLQSLLSNLWSAFLVIFFFGSSIFVHELGHFWAARRRGVFVERFSIGMGPAIFRWRGKSGVEYWLSWLPLGGYVKLPQLADMREVEGDSTVDIATLPAVTFTTKLIVFLAGAVFNLIFAFLLACMLWFIGMPMSQEISTTKIGYVMHDLKLSDGTKQQSPASKADLRPGDVILAIDGTKVDDWAAITQALALSSGRTADGKDRLVHLRIKRGDEVLDKDVNPILADEEKVRRIGIAPAYELLVGQVTPNSLSAELGLKAGDRIRKVDTTPLLNLTQLGDYLESHSAGTVTLLVQRGAQSVSLSVPPQRPNQELLAGAEFTLPVQLVHQDPVVQFKTVFNGTIQSLASLVNPHSDVGISKMSGPIGIVHQWWQVATGEYPFRTAAYFTILINISLAGFNLLPIPILDGGHILFAFIAKLRGRALPTDFVHAAQSVFFVLLFSLLMYVSFYDVRRIVRSDKSEPAHSAPAPTVPATAAPTPAKP